MTGETAPHLRRRKLPTERLGEEPRGRLVLTGCHVPSLDRAVPVQPAVHVILTGWMYQVSVSILPGSEFPFDRRLSGDRTGMETFPVSTFRIGDLVTAAGKRV